MALVSTLALLAASGANRIATTFAGRPRPYTRVLDGEGQVKRHPTGHPERLRSFFSGHTALTTTGVSLVATFAIHLNWVRSAGLWALAVTALGVTVAVATLRMRADRHYFSDVAVGAVVGVMCGAIYPIWAHFSAI
ncbi:MAG: membrane-associated phospholipid phosphatase [Myxococcota bacterium]|jgi:membrane-associated phospholipid phosphatase